MLTLEAQGRKLVPCCLLDGTEMYRHRGTEVGTPRHGGTQTGVRDLVCYPAGMPVVPVCNHIAMYVPHSPILLRYTPRCRRRQQPDGLTVMV